MSFIGYLDKRVDLGKFKPGDKKYFGALCAVASKVSYENRAFIQSVVQHRWEVIKQNMHHLHSYMSVLLEFGSVYIIDFIYFNSNFMQMDFLGAYDFWNGNFFFHILPLKIKIIYKNFDS